MKLLLVRHGHVPGIRPERFRGRMELELTELGVSEASRTASWIKEQHELAVVYVSPLKRCIETARAIAQCCGVRMEVMEALNDLDYGGWQGKTQVEIAAQSPDLFQRWRTSPQWMRFPEGESLQELVARAADALRTVVEQHPSETVVMVTHDSVIRAMLLQLLDQPLSAFWRLAQDPCGISEVLIEVDRVVVTKMNQTAHLYQTKN